MDLTIGPNQFFWDADTWAGFYGDMADKAASRVVVGELVCSKRLPFYQDRIPSAIETLLNAGKTVALTSLALVTLKRERKLTADLGAMGVPVEINDLTALAHVPQGAEFWVGPLVNVYNEGTFRWLASRGATRICLPPELPLASVRTLAALGAELGVAIEVWGFGRLPLAISGRCYHARLHGRTKDNCQFACEDDPEGLSVLTTDGQPFLAMNGVQTLSDSTACLVRHIDLLRDAGVDALRLSPQTGAFGEVIAGFCGVLDGTVPADRSARVMAALAPGGRLSDGFLTGACGADWSGKAA